MSTKSTTTSTETETSTPVKVKKPRKIRPTIPDDAPIVPHVPATKKELRTMVAGTYQIQKVRIQIGNRLVGNFKAKLGQAPSTSEKNLESEAKKILDGLREDYRIITDGIKNFPTRDKFKAYGLISSHTELVLMEQYILIEKVEKDHFKRIEAMLEDFPIWNTFLKPLYGIGAAIGGTLVSEIDIEKATYPTSLWRLAGVDVAWDGHGRSKRKAHLEQREYTKKSGKKAMKNSITYKPKLKTKLMGLMASSFVKCGDRSPYTAIYYDYKHRLENHPEHRDNYLAVNVDACKATLGAVPKKILRRSYIARFFSLCEARVRELDPDLGDEEAAKAARALMKTSLGPYEIYEKLLDQDLVLPCSYFIDEVQDKVTNLNGVLRAPKEVEIFVDEEDATEEEDAGIRTIEEFDDTPDKKGRILFKLVNIGKTKAHRNMMAYRYIVKQFLRDLYKAWRTLEGLPVAESYEVAKLGLVHHEVSWGKVAKPSVASDEAYMMQDMNTVQGTMTDLPDDLFM